MLTFTILLSAIVFAIVALVIKIAYKFVLKPKKQINQYVQQLKKNNWKVLNLGFIPFDTKIRSITFDSAKTYEDCHFELKNSWPKYDIVVCNFVDRPYIQLINPQLAKEFYELENQKTFRKYTVLIRQLERMVGKSITFSQGARWKNKRKVMTQFLNFSFIKSVTEKIETICQREMEVFFSKNIIKDETHDSKPVSQIHIQEMIEMINSTVIAEIFFGGGNEKVDSIQIDGKGLPHFMRDLMEEIFRETIDPLSVILGVKFVQLGVREMDRRCNNLLKKFRQFVTNFVHNRLYEIEQQINKGTEIKQAKDLIEAFYLEVGLEKINENKKDFIDNLINDFANLYTAGTDTTQHATMMTIYYIHKHLQVKKKLLQEIEKCKGTGENKNKRELSYDSVKNIAYLEAVCFETLRMYQTANGIFPREVLTPVTIGGVTYQKDTVIATQTFPVHFKSEIYQNPHQFNPQRWIDKQGKLKNPQPYCFNTFSHGIRSCIGKQLALQEIKMFVVNFCSKFDCEFDTLDFKFNMHGFAYEPQNIKMKFWKK